MLQLIELGQIYIYAGSVRLVDHEFALILMFTKLLIIHGPSYCIDFGSYSPPSLCTRSLISISCNVS